MWATEIDGAKCPTGKHLFICRAPLLEWPPNSSAWFISALREIESNRRAIDLKFHGKIRTDKIHFPVKRVNTFLTEEMECFLFGRGCIAQGRDNWSLVSVKVDYWNVIFILEIKICRNEDEWIWWSISVVFVCGYYLTAHVWRWREMRNICYCFYWNKTLRFLFSELWCILVSMK